MKLLIVCAGLAALIYYTSGGEECNFGRGTCEDPLEGCDAIPDEDGKCASENEVCRKKEKPPPTPPPTTTEPTTTKPTTTEPTTTPKPQWCNSNIEAYCRNYRDCPFHNVVDDNTGSCNSTFQTCCISHPTRFCSTNPYGRCAPIDSCKNPIHDAIGACQSHEVCCGC